MRLRILTGLVLATWAASAHAQATSPLTVERFVPNANGKGLFSAESAVSLEQWQPFVGHVLHYNRDGLRQAGLRSSLLSQRLTADVQLGVGLGKGFEISMAVPLVLVNEKGSAPGAAGGLLGPGPMRVALRYAPLNEKDHGIGLGLALNLAFPVAYSDGLLSEDGATFAPVLLIEKRFSKTVRALLNVGYLTRKEARYRIPGRNIAMDDEVFWRFGMGFNFTENTEVGFELNGGTAAADMYGSEVGKNPLEALFGFKYNWKSGAQWSVGFGPGLQAGYGTPAFRVFTGFGYAPGEKDSDGDGVYDSVDRCPQQPGPKENQGCPWPDSDNDGILDKDDKCPTQAGPKENQGCPWPDSDGDGVLDKDDKCPNVAGPVENQGCPWPDTDGDGIPDKDDKCPKEPGPKENNGCPIPKVEVPADKDGDGVADKDDKCPDVAGPKENNGCPWPDTDGDGVPDKDDKCPKVKGPAENNGCPWPDRDKDGVPDKDDKCPDQPGPADNDGCPKEGVKVTREDVQIPGRIRFGTGSATITAGKKILDEVAQILNKYTFLKKVEVQGHTDDVGSLKGNTKLSQRRAEAVVKYLVKKKVAKDRLVAKGFGPTVPRVAIDKTKPKKELVDARKENRRVEFKILEKSAP